MIFFFTCTDCFYNLCYAAYGKSFGLITPMKSLGVSCYITCDQFEFFSKSEMVNTTHFNIIDNKTCVGVLGSFISKDFSDSISYFFTRGFSRTDLFDKTCLHLWNYFLSNSDNLSYLLKINEVNASTYCNDFYKFSIVYTFFITLYATLKH